MDHRYLLKVKIAGQDLYEESYDGRTRDLVNMIMQVGFLNNLLAFQLSTEQSLQLR